MREIKFRAWDKYRQEFVNPAAYASLYNVNGEKNIAIATPDGVHIKLSQYTGLRDKHGVEIYEGDIISDGDEYVPSLEVVDWEEITARFNFPEIMGGGFLLNESYEVIGNIYEHEYLLENKELLK